ncbi:alpha-mannosidase [Actinopolyspora sp. H202]|uniref:alpha-mannosidase n=1 Tax=Actinopolyspora sp. H202 TaxID=1500456 RepID=UPI003EE445E5
MHDDRKLTEERIERMLRDRVRPALRPESAPVTLDAWHGTSAPVPVTDRSAGGEYHGSEVGERWGPPWSTTWFRLRGEIPVEWAGRAVELVFDPGFDHRRPGFQCEGLVYRPDGSIVKGLNPRNEWVRVSEAVAGGEPVEFHVEAAANPVILGDHSFTPTELGDPATTGTEPLYRIERAELTLFDNRVEQLVHDIEVLDQLMRQLGTDEPRRWEILRALDRCMDAVDPRDVGGSAGRAREVLSPVLRKPAHASAHRVSAIGHAHIDSAWLWPFRETGRKVARTVSNVLGLLEEHPEFVFAMSQAQQFAWLERRYPQLHRRVRSEVAAGRFVPVGGMWVEADTNMPGGEAMARQLVHGKRFFLDEFGVETDEVWLPDSFGYSAALPQLITLSGSSWFLGQKVVWNQTNAFPHHTFHWEGIDGTRILTHLPPVDVYDSELSAAELAHASANFAEKGGANRSLVPFGWGDGGGGPTREMLARAERLADLEGSPRVTVESPAEFVREARAEYTAPPVWVGELYLEFHRGTYTSQAGTKRGNRHNEHLLREAELWAATANVYRALPYPYERLDRLWKAVLRNQFHDVLPGSSIAWVHHEAEREHELVRGELAEIIDRAQRKLAGSGSTPLVFNGAPHERAGVPSGGAAPSVEPAAFVKLSETDDGFVLRDESLRVTIDRRGTVTSLRDLAADREVVPAGSAGNVLRAHPDLPNRWDAWDIDSFYRNNVTELLDAEEVAVVEEAADRVSVRVVRAFSHSRITQTLTLRGGAARLEIDTEVDWHESETLLKLAFPVDVHTDRMAAETQFGHLYRPIHENTSWDAAKFETCAHRWVHVGEAGYGVALANDATYGHDVTRWAKNGGGTAATVRASLLRAPRFPDPHTDRGTHRFRHVLVPGADIGDAVREGYRLNLPSRTVRGASPVDPLVTSDNAAVVLEAVKLAEDGSGDVVVRLYESSGGRATSRITTGFVPMNVRATDLLERPWADGEIEHDTAGFRVTLRPFEIRTLRLERT